MNILSQFCRRLRSFVRGRGRASFDRTHRFVFSTTWMLPSPLRGVLHDMLGGWLLGAVATLQVGSALTFADTNSKNVFGISQDRAQLSGTCSALSVTRLLTLALDNWR